MAEYRVQVLVLGMWTWENASLFETLSCRHVAAGADEGVQFAATGAPRSCLQASHRHLAGH